VAGGDPLTTPERLIAAPRVIPASAGNQVLEPGYVIHSGGVITAVGQGPPPRSPDMTLPAGTLLPGFVDLQVNGYFGIDFQNGDAAGWAHAAGLLPQTGVTAFLPTFITAPLGALGAALRSAPEKIRSAGTGARVLGVHTEGPFISPARKGAHNEAWIIDPAPAAVDELIDAGQGVLRLVTLAPERDGALAAITRLTAAGIEVSVGHSDATAALVARAADHGARMVTHLFNAQRPLHHREPGVVGQALTDQRLTSGLIADMHHVSPAACVLALRAAPGRIAAVTDAAACAGMPPGSYQLGGEEIVLPPGDGEPPVRRDGTLAGSALRMDVAVANLTAAGIGLAEAVGAATRVPADLIGRADLGRIAPGAAADLVWLGDDLRAMVTWIGGEVVFSRTGAGVPAPAGGGQR
jgi:N-acetylglucosamine-6-phosphate deacetylase